MMPLERPALTVATAVVKPASANGEPTLRQLLGPRNARRVASDHLEEAARHMS